MTDFEALYQQHPDPWGLSSTWYERRKRHLLLASLPRQSYRHALEVGCGAGECTALLAARCVSVHAIDLSVTALARCSDLLARSAINNVKASNMRVPQSWPNDLSACFDLVVVSEVAYYLQDTELSLFFERGFDSLAPGGDWLMCHYLPPFHDRKQDTPAMHQSVAALPGLSPVLSHRDELFQLDIWRKSMRGAP